jgi:Tfp pilus assembly protein PilV
MNGRNGALRRHTRLRRSARGVALLEVVIAMALMSMCGLGLLSAQLGLARHALASGVRARAAFAADALAEASLQVSMAPRDQWKARVADIVPEGRATVSPTAGSTSFVVLTWVALRDEAAPRALQAAPGCEEGVVAAQGRACVALAFAQ